MNTIGVSLHPVMYSPSTVKVSITNKSPDTCYEVPSQVFTENNLADNNFRVTDQGGQRVTYIGPQIDRISTYTALLPGETKSVKVQLDTLYDLPAGHYTVQYKAAANYRACSNPADSHRETLQSNLIDIKV